MSNLIDPEGSHTFWVYACSSWYLRGLNTKSLPRFDRRVVRDKNPTSGVDRERVVYNPNAAMRRVHTWLAEYLVGYVMPATRSWSAHATACRLGVSIFDDVVAHRKARCIYVTDIRQAFPTLRADALAQCIAGLEGQTDLKHVVSIQNFLEKNCFEPGGKGLIIGGNASNLLFELFVRYWIDRLLVARLQVELNAWVIGFRPYQAERPIFDTFEECLADNEVQTPILHWIRQQEEIDRRAQGITLHFTRYLDDLKISCDKPLPYKVWERIKRIVREVIRQAGFDINQRKTHFWDLKKGPVQLNGIGLEYGGRMFVPRFYQRACRTQMKESADYYDVLVADCGTNTDNWPRDERRLLASWIRRIKGQIGYIKESVRASQRHTGLAPNGTDRAFLEAARVWLERFDWLSKPQ